MKGKNKIILGCLFSLGLLISLCLLGGCIGEGEDDNFYILNDGLSLEITDFLGNLTLSITGNQNQVKIGENVSLESVKILGSDNIVYVSNNHRNFTTDINEYSNSKIVFGVD